MLGVKSNRSVPQATVIPVLIYPDVREAVDWLGTAFGFVQRVWIGESHRSQLSFGEGAVIVGDVRNEHRPPRPGEVRNARRRRPPRRGRDLRRIGLVLLGGGQSWACDKFHAAATARRALRVYWLTACSSVSRPRRISGRAGGLSAASRGRSSRFCSLV